MFKDQDFIRLDRRKFLAVAGSLIAAGVLPKSVLALAKPQAFKHGSFDVTVVSDGTAILPLAIVSPSASPDELKTLLGASVRGTGHRAELNAVLVKTDSEVILFDTGVGTNPEVWPEGGHLLDSLKAAGVDAGAVTKVIYTHAHPDHLMGSVTKDGKVAFPNASFHIAETELDYWLQTDLASKTPKNFQPFVAAAQSVLASVKDKISTFKPGSELTSGIGVIDTAGHTPGHVSFELAGDDGLLLVGDTITVPQVFFAHPDWTFGFDMDSDAARKTRRAFLEYAAKGKKKMLGYHWTYPGFGMAEAKDNAFVYVPHI